jgi:hypothetical protein
MDEEEVRERLRDLDDMLDVVMRQLANCLGQPVVDSDKPREDDDFALTPLHERGDDTARGGASETMTARELLDFVNSDHDEPTATILWPDDMPGLEELLKSMPGNAKESRSLLATLAQHGNPIHALRSLLEKVPSGSLREKILQKFVGVRKTSGDSGNE